MARGYHFYQRVDRHKEVLHEKRVELDKAIKMSLKGVVKEPKIHVHPSHIHVFANIEEGKKLFFVSRIKNEITKLEGIKWDAEYYLTPVSSTSREYVTNLLRDLHREQLI